MALGVEAPPPSDPSIRRAKNAIVKKMLYTPRPKLFLTRNMMRNMVLAVDRRLETHSFAALWMLSYWFLLRVPSEALPAVVGNKVR